MVDATNVQPEARRSLVELAKAHHVWPSQSCSTCPRQVCADRNASRPDRSSGPRAAQPAVPAAPLHAWDEAERASPGLRSSKTEEVEGAVIERQPLWTDRRTDTGPFDIIGDIHGCHDELVELLGSLGYEVTAGGDDAHHPAGRRALFLGDLVDRGPATPAVLRLVMGMVGAGHALCIPGNHEAKLLRALRGAQSRPRPRLAESFGPTGGRAPEFRAQVVDFIDGLVSHFVLDDGRLVVAHAGIARRTCRAERRAPCGRSPSTATQRVRPTSTACPCVTRGPRTTAASLVVYGHTPVPEAVWLNRTICIDTGCVFGGQLTALRYPERELVSVPAHEIY